MGLNSLQRVLGDEECNLHRAVVPPKTHRAPRCIERAALVGKTQRHRASFRSRLRCEIAQPRPPNAAPSRYPLSRAKYLPHATATAATPKQTAAANVRLNRVVTCHAPHDCRRERDRSLSATGAYIVHVLWSVMAEAAPYSAHCPGQFDLYRRSLRVVEPVTGTAYIRDVRAWPCFVAHLPVCLP